MPPPHTLDSCINLLFCTERDYRGGSIQHIQVPYIEGGYSKTMDVHLEIILKPNNRKKIIQWIENGKNYNVLNMLEQ